MIETFSEMTEIMELADKGINTARAHAHALVSLKT